MKIKRHRRTSSTSGYEVSGPAYEARAVPAGHDGSIALALDLAARLKAPGTFYVRHYGDVIYRAEGDGKGAARLQRAA